jgi:DNA-binding NtrC family response regulator
LSSTRSNAVRFTDVQGASTRAALGACRMTVPAARIRVLLVEPHDDSRELYRIGLTAAGFDVVAVGNVPDAMVACADRRPSVIVSETRLPGPSDGLTRLVGTGVPLVALTTDPFFEHAAHAGLCAVLLKPCFPADVAAAIRNALALEPR